MKDIAQDLGVSLMTVSKALRNHNDIGQQTRQRVLERAKQSDTPRKAGGLMSGAASKAVTR